ncbi:JAB domain-containing protein [Dialister micraerophilus]|uniref:JAB domain-containing protein n=1 Tax=Dialister micraerophilus TaxID=309120 RepID=UPI0023F52086|nr:JAB domain-containing protein [Dialister micraerophilus]
MKTLTKYQVYLKKEENYNIPDKPLNQPQQVVDLMEDIFNLSQATQEIAVMIAVDCHMKPIGVFELSRGTLNQGIMHARDIFQRAIMVNAYAIFLAHNHPSGDSTPSDMDDILYLQLKEDGIRMGIPIKDSYVIVDRNNYTSIPEHMEEERKREMKEKGIKEKPIIKRVDENGITWI